MARKSSTKPYADTQLVSFLQRRLLELRPRKSQIDIAAEHDGDDRVRSINDAARTRACVGARA
jgi:hypothetical protein